LRIKEQETRLTLHEHDDDDDDDIIECICWNNKTFVGQTSLGTDKMENNFKQLQSCALHPIQLNEMQYLSKVPIASCTCDKHYCIWMPAFCCMEAALHCIAIQISRIWLYLVVPELKISEH
jgi:hypothetical protein